MLPAVRPAANLDAALPWLDQAGRFDATGGVATVGEMCADEAAFELCAPGGIVVGAFSVGVQTFADGRVLRCGAAGGAPGFDHVGAIVRFGLDAAPRVGASALVCETSRRSMVRRLQRDGFRVTGYLLRKDL